MDKRTIIGMVVMLAVFAAYQITAVKLHQKHPEWFSKSDETSSVIPSTGPATQVAATTSPTTQGTLTTAPAIAAIAGYHAVPGTGGQVVLGSLQHSDPKYPLGISIVPQGAGLQSATLNAFKKDVRDPSLYEFQTPYDFADTDLNDALATRWVKINGNQIDLHNATWTLMPGSDPTKAVYTIDVADNITNQPVLKISKTYTVKDSRDPSKGYEIGVNYDYENVGTVPLKVRASFNGTNAPEAENRNDTPSVIGGYSDEQTIKIKNLPTASFTEKQKEAYFSTHFDWKNVWVGITSAYFNALIRPDDKSSVPVERIEALALNPGEKDTLKHRAAIVFETRESDIAPSKSGATAMSVYLGPKQRAILNSDYYTTFPRSYDKTLVLTSGFCSICTFTWLVDILVNMLRGFHWVLHDWGLSIILLVCLVRLLLHPITKRSQISMSRMGKMGPEMEKLKKKYADDPDGLRKQQAELIREQGITPILGCLPMFLQMPIWIALYQSLQTTFELRHAPFLWNFTWIKDLSRPDSLIAFQHPINLYFFSVTALNLLPFFMAGVFFIQQKVTPKPVAATKEQEQQQKMMQWMSLLFPVMLYTGPAGLNLYILTSTAIGIIESKRIRDHIKEREEAEKDGKVIVDAPNTRNRKRFANDAARTAPAKKEGWLTNVIANMHAKMEEVQREADKKKKGKK